eukprot:355370-Chlamydomonas_euryale.AAC.6
MSDTTMYQRLHVLSRAITANGCCIDDQPTATVLAPTLSPTAPGSLVGRGGGHIAAVCMGDLGGQWPCRMPTAVQLGGIVLCLGACVYLQPRDRQPQWVTGLFLSAHRSRAASNSFGQAVHPGDMAVQKGKWAVEMKARWEGIQDNADVSRPLGTTSYGGEPNKPTGQAVQTLLQGSGVSVLGNMFFPSGLARLVNKHTHLSVQHQLACTCVQNAPKSPPCSTVATSRRSCCIRYTSTSSCTAHAMLLLPHTRRDRGTCLRCKHSFRGQYANHRRAMLGLYIDRLRAFPFIDLVGRAAC